MIMWTYQDIVSIVRQAPQISDMYANWGPLHIFQLMCAFFDQGNQHGTCKWSVFLSSINREVCFPFYVPAGLWDRLPDRWINIGRLAPLLPPNSQVTTQLNKSGLPTGPPIHSISRRLPVELVPRGLSRSAVKSLYHCQLWHCAFLYNHKPYIRPWSLWHSSQFAALQLPVTLWLTQCSACFLSDSSSYSGVFDSAKLK